MITPAQDYHRTDHVVPGKLLSGPDAWTHGLVGVYRRRQSVLAELDERAAEVDAQAEQWKNLNDHHLQERLYEFREKFRRRRRATDLLLTEALGAMREAAERKVGLRPFHVQLMGALALHRGYLTEMATGEGKTLTAGLAAVLAGWSGCPCHIVTANDYLVQRDAEWLRPLYHFCGLKAGFVTGEMNPVQRRFGYDQDITYTTSKEIVADFLRDRLRLGAWQNPSRRLIQSLLHPQYLERTDLVMRGLHTAIVDEGDSLLVDEAVTPLIISAPLKNEVLREACRQAQATALLLEASRDYRIDLRHREVELTESGKQKVTARSNELTGLFRSLNRRLELVQQALVAREFFHRGKQYVVVDDKVVIVDEYTGRMMPQRTWRAGLHQAIEAKEGIEITDPTETLARLSFQRFFRLFRKLSGMTGTARETAGEFWQVYRLSVITIPTNRPCCREVFPDRIFATAEQKWQAILEDVGRVHATDRPVLIGTRSVAASERLADLLRGRGLEFHLLNALRHREEAQIIAEAGHRGRITIATNMAGRGTDIRLGQGMAEMGGLHVVASERHEAGRIDRQLFGRAARQGDPGSAQAYVSFEDELLQRYLPGVVRRQVQAMLQANRPGAHRLASAMVTLAQHRAERQAVRQRRAVLKMDTWLDEALSFAGTNIA
ncbi:MAG: preprotein translocase subunit SecA [Limisphaerales bacterium]